MNFSSIIHEAKNIRYVYPVDEHNLHVRIKTQKNDVQKVSITYGDPFHWGEVDGVWRWKRETAASIEMVKEYSSEYYDHWFVSISSNWRRVKYSFILESNNEEFHYGCRTIKSITKNEANLDDLFNYFNFPYINNEDIYRSPKWVKDTVWYQIFPERFNKSNEFTGTNKLLEWNSTTDVTNHMFFGGNIKGITEKLEYIQDYGFNGIYFTPFFESPSSHKYDIVDYFAVDKNFGTNEHFKELVDKAHSLGIKIMLDAVFNHCSFHHPFFQDVIKNGKNSKYYDYFFVQDIENIINFKLDENNHPIHSDIIPNFYTFAFTPTMPKWNTEHPEVRKYLIEVGTFWVREFNIDGWRLDVSNEVSHLFWREFRQAIKEINKDVYIIGENWDNSSPWLQGDQFDAVMNYELTFPIWSFFCHKYNHVKINATDFMFQINKLMTDYPKPVLENLFNIVDSHDTERILNLCKENKDLAKLVYTFQMTMPGSPSIYYGGEVGITGAHDPKNRRCMIWEESEWDQDMRTFISNIINIRKNNFTGDFENITWHLADNRGIIIYEINNIIIILNNSNENISLNTPSTISTGNYTDLLSNTNVEIKNTLDIPSYKALLLQK